jgi:hypothetical protein
MNSDGSPASGIARSPRAARALIGCISLLVAALGQAGPPVDPATVDVGHPTGHLHDHGDQTWPPQPRGAQYAVLLSNPADEGLIAETRKRRSDAQERLAVARADVRQALGTRFTRAAVVEDRDKSGAVLGSRLVYFSHSKNSTVEVSFDGERVRGLRMTPAAEYQPEITDAESAEAEGIARAHFAALGEGRVSQLRAFGILAYQPFGKGFYATRVLYISFHRDSDAPPEYVAWVDLTERRVLRARQEGQ